jgi:hypothetical protein
MRWRPVEAGLRVVTSNPQRAATRFPRIKAIRRDKTVDAIDTLACARALINEREAR